MVFSNDNRLFERFQAQFPIKFKDSRKDYGTDVFLRNVCAEGVKILSRERLFLNDKISLNILLPDGQEPMTVNGEVRWIKTVEPDQMWNYGVQFHKVDLMKLQRLYQHTEELLPSTD